MNPEPKVPERIMIPEFLKQRFMILTCFVSMIHDSWFHFHPRYFLMLPQFIPSFSLIFTDLVLLILRCAATTCPSTWLLRYCRMSLNRVDDLGENAKPQPFAPVDTTVAMPWPFLSTTSPGGTLGIAGWEWAAGTLEPLTYTRVSSAEFCCPILE